MIYIVIAVTLLWAAVGVLFVILVGIGINYRQLAEEVAPIMEAMLDMIEALREEFPELEIDPKVESIIDPKRGKLQ